LLPIENSYHEFETTKRFFKHFLIAKQLLDDQHDWYDDLTRGIVNPICEQILIVYKKPSCNLLLDKNELQKIFWDSVFEETTLLIVNHLNLAEKSLLEINILHSKQFLQDRINYYRKIVTHGLEEKTLTDKFISVYEKTTITGGL
jgi:hypothetical protein